MRARIAAWYTSSFTIGASLSFLLGRIGTLWGCAALLFSPESSVPPVSSLRGPHCRGRIQESPNRRARSSTSDRSRQSRCPRPDLGYAAAIWGSVGLRQWIVVFLRSCRGSGRVPGASLIMLAVGALISFWRPGRAFGNELSIRTHAQRRYPCLPAVGGRGRPVRLHPACCLHRRRLAVVIGFTVRGNFANLTSVSSPHPPHGTEGNDRSVFLRRLWRWFLGTLLFGSRSIGSGEPRLPPDTELQHRGLACLASAAAAFSCPETSGNGSKPLAYAGTGWPPAVPSRAAARRALRLRPAEIATTPMPM